MVTHGMQNVDDTQRVSLKAAKSSVKVPCFMPEKGSVALRHQNVYKYRHERERTDPAPNYPSRQKTRVIYAFKSLLTLAFVSTALGVALLEPQDGPCVVQCSATREFKPGPLIPLFVK